MSRGRHYSKIIGMFWHLSRHVFGTFLIPIFGRLFGRFLAGYFPGFFSPGFRHVSRHVSNSSFWHLLRHVYDGFCPRKVPGQKPARKGALHSPRQTCQKTFRFLVSNLPIPHKTAGNLACFQAGFVPEKTCLKTCRVSGRVGEKIECLK